jgi:hypothetical protein
MTGVSGAIPRVMVGSATQLACYETVKKWLISRNFFGTARLSLW